MQINMDDCTPWPEINRDIKNMRTLRIVADGKTHTGNADLSIDDFGNVTVTVGRKGKK